MKTTTTTKERQNCFFSGLGAGSDEWPRSGRDLKRGRQDRNRHKKEDRSFGRALLFLFFSLRMVRIVARASRSGE